MNLYNSFLTEKGNPFERMVRKAMGLKLPRGAMTARLPKQDFLHLAILSVSPPECQEAESH